MFAQFGLWYFRFRLTCRKRRWPTLDKSEQVLRSWLQSILWQSEHWGLEQLGATNARVHVPHTIDIQFDWDIWPKISCLKSKTFWPELSLLLHASFDFGEEKRCEEQTIEQRPHRPPASSGYSAMIEASGEVTIQQAFLSPLFGPVPPPITSFHSLEIIHIHSKAISFYRVKPKKWPFSILLYFF